MAYTVDFNTVSTNGLESSPVAAALAGVRANEARYFKNKYGHVFTVETANKAKPIIDWVHRILNEERDLVIKSRPLEATSFQVENLRIAYVFYESGLSINVMYSIDDPKRRAVGFKLSAGMDVPTELASRFKFATQKSKLAGTIRGSFFVIKGEYWSSHVLVSGDDHAGSARLFTSLRMPGRVPVGTCMRSTKRRADRRSTSSGFKHGGWPIEILSPI